MALQMIHTSPVSRQLSAGSATRQAVAVSCRYTPARRHHVIVCAQEAEPQATPAPVSSSTSAASPQGGAGTSTSHGPMLAIGAVASAVVLFAASRLGGTEVPTLTTLEAMSTPIEVALGNNKPTVIEFYASWCSVCKELVPTEYALEQKYKDKVNFVMLNIENSKWAPEVAEFRVRGIPHFVFVTKDNEALAAAVGRLPAEVLEGNVEALVNDTQLPFTGAAGPTSSMQAPAAMAGPKQTAPRDHA